MREMRWLGLFLSALLLYGCGAKPPEEEQSIQGTAVEVQTAAAAPMSATHRLSGKVAAQDLVQVFPMLAGEVTSLAVSAGDWVSAGQVLFTVDTSAVTSSEGALKNSYEATRQATDVAIQMAESSVAQAELGISQAQTALDNATALFEVGAVAEQDVTRARDALTQAEAAKVQAQNGIEQARAQQKASLAQIQASLDQMNTQAGLGRITAPVSGIVTMVNIAKGGMAAQAQPALMIATNGAVEVQTAVAEQVFAALQRGARAEVILSVLGEEPIPATIGALPPAANLQTGLYDITLRLPAGQNPVIGAFATVIFYTDRRDSTISVPSEAILTGEDEQSYLFVCTAENTAKQVIVKTGLVGERSTEITEGLAAGDLVVVRGQSYLADGDVVRIVAKDGTEIAA